MRDLRPLRVEPDGALAQYADLASVTRDAANDMFVDAKGHAWVGSFGFDFYAVLEADPNADPLFGPGANRLQRLSRMSRRMARYRLRRRGCVFRAAPCNCRTARS